MAATNSLVFWAKVAAYTQIVASLTLLAASVIFLCKVRCQHQFMFMIQMLVIIAVLTVSSIVFDIINGIWLKDPDKSSRKPWFFYTMAISQFVFWVSAYLCVWLISLKYHEQSRQMLRIENLSSMRNEKRNKRALQGSSGDAPEHEALIEDDTGDLRDSVIVDDSKFVEYVQQKVQHKKTQYTRVRWLGIAVIVSIEAFLELIYAVLREPEQQRLLMLCSIIGVGLEMAMWLVAIAILIIATRTMEKIEKASGAEQSIMKSKTINLNIIAAFLQLASYVIWTGGLFTA
jgi:hypothetical protein